jgi:hypothetical protein
VSGSNSSCQMPSLSPADALPPVSALLLLLLLLLVLPNVCPCCFKYLKTSVGSLQEQI